MHSYISDEFPLGPGDDCFCSHALKWHWQMGKKGKKIEKKKGSSNFITRQFKRNL
jgi:hypothetical protein